MNVLLSIRPKYVREIIEGRKRYEFRKVVFRNREASEVYIYATYPEKKIVAKFQVGRIIEDHPSKLWEMFGKEAGINKEEFFRYFKGRDRGFAIEIKNLKKLNKPINPQENIPGFIPPQSFCYINISLDHEDFPIEPSK